MSKYDRQDRECEEMQKRHGPGGQLPYFCELTIGGQQQEAKAKATEIPETPESPVISASYQKSDIQRVKACVLSIIPYATMSGVVFWWQQTGHLVKETGFWALIVIGILGAYKAGKIFSK